MIKKQSIPEAMEKARPCPCGYCGGEVHMAQVSKAKKVMILGYVVTCKTGELKAEPHYDVHVAVERWNALVRKFEEDEDAELGAIAEARAREGGFIKVDIDRI